MGTRAGARSFGGCVMVAILVGVTAACAVATVLLCAFAPVGWQDEDGFHYGVPDDEKDSPP